MKFVVLIWEVHNKEIPTIDTPLISALRYLCFLLLACIQNYVLYNLSLTIIYIQLQLVYIRNCSFIFILVKLQLGFEVEMQNFFIHPPPTPREGTCILICLSSCLSVKTVECGDVYTCTVDIFLVGSYFCTMKVNFDQVLL